MIFCQKTAREMTMDNRRKLKYISRIKEMRKKIFYTEIHKTFLLLFNFSLLPFNWPFLIIVLFLLYLILVQK